MKKKILLGVLLTLISSLNMFAGHHFESDLARKYPQLDLTDIYVFSSSTPGKTVFIMSFNPQSKKDSLGNYSSAGIYRFCIGGDASFSTGISPTFTFNNNKIQFYLPKEAEPAINFTGTMMAEGPINRQLELSNGIKIWTGTVLDLFQGNAGGIGPFKEQAAKGKFDLSTFDVGEKGNIFANLPSSVIVLELPNEMLPKKFFYYATTSVEMEANHWHRVNRISHVLFPHLYLLDQNIMGKYTDANHEVDEELTSSIYNNILHYTKIAGFQKDPEAYAKALVKQIYPDVLTYEVGTDAEYSIARRNGRPLQADAMNIALALLVGSENPIDDKVSIILERYQDVFPYVVPIDSEYINATNKVVKITVDSENTKFTDGSIESEGKDMKVLWYVIGGIVVFLILILLIKKKKS